MQERILFVDDDANVLDAYYRKLHGVLDVHTAQGPNSGLREIEQRGPFAVVVTDMKMPMMNGVEFLTRVKAIAPETVRIMLTGEADIHIAMDAVNSGSVFRFLTKPCPANVMGEALVSGIAQYRLVISERELLEGTLKGTTEMLTEVLSWVCPTAFGHALLVRNSVSMLAKALGARDIWQIEIAAALSQIGLLAIPSEIATKHDAGTTLSLEENAAIESVPAIGQELLHRIPRLDEVAKIVLYTQKHFDGAGFPADAVAGAGIPLGSRILKAAGDFHRLREQGMSYDDAVNEMLDRHGWYDPAVLNVLFAKIHDPIIGAASNRVHSIPLSQLTHGMTLATAIRTLEGHKLIGAGTCINHLMLVRLHRYAQLTGIAEPIDVLD